MAGWQPCHALYRLRQQCCNANRGDSGGFVQNVGMGSDPHGLYLPQ